MDDNVHVIHTGGSAGDMAHGEAQYSRGQHSRHPHWKKCWRQLERLSSVDDNVHVIHTRGSAGGTEHGEAEFCG